MFKYVRRICIRQTCFDEFPPGILILKGKSQKAREHLKCQLHERLAHCPPERAQLATVQTGIGLAVHVSLYYAQCQTRRGGAHGAFPSRTFRISPLRRNVNRRFHLIPSWRQAVAPPIVWRWALRHARFHPSWCKTDDGPCDGGGNPASGCGVRPALATIWRCSGLRSHSAAAHWRGSILPRPALRFA